MRPGISRALGVFTYLASASLTFYYFASNTPIGGLKGLQTHEYYQDRYVECTGKLKMAYTSV